MPKKQRLKFPEAVVAISVERERENELQEARAIQLAMLASEPLHTAGDSVVFLSDGLVGAMTEQGELLGLERIAEILTGCREKPPRAILEALFSEVERFS